AQAVIAANIGAIPYVKDPRVRALASTGRERSKFLSELPTVAESAPGDELRNYSFDSWIGILGPAGIPRQTVDAINAAVAKLLKDPVILERLDKQGVVPQTRSPQASGEHMRADSAKTTRSPRRDGESPRASPSARFRR